MTDTPEHIDDATVRSVCLTYRHDFGLLPREEQASCMFRAREWLRSWLKSAPEHVMPEEAKEPAARIAALEAEIKHMTAHCIRMTDERDKYARYWSDVLVRAEKAEAALAAHPCDTSGVVDHETGSGEARANLPIIRGASGWDIIDDKRTAHASSRNVTAYEMYGRGQCDIVATIDNAR